MDPSQIVNPTVRDIWSRSIWYGSPDAPASTKTGMNVLFVLWMLAFFGALFSGVYIGAYCIIIIAVLFVLMIPLVIAVRPMRWRNSDLIYAITPTEIFFTVKSHALSVKEGSYFWENLSNIIGYKKKIDKGSLTVILVFANPASAGIYGKNLKELPLFRISNVDNLIRVLVRMGKPEIK